MINEQEVNMHEMANVLMKLMDRVPDASLLAAVGKLPTIKVHMLLAELKKVAGERSEPLPKTEQVWPFETNGAPMVEIQKAKSMFDGYLAGRVRLRTYKADKKYRAIDVTHSYRLFSRNAGVTWTLMSHAQYEQAIRAK